jgi:hypothetical protein
MRSDSSLTTTQVLAVFAEEIAAHGGQVTDTFHDGQRLFTRSILPHVEEVRPGDRMQGGVALKASDEGVWLYPYLFRLVCRNGAIAAETIEAHFLEFVHLQEPDTALQSLRDGIAICSAQEVFVGNVRKMRSACALEADVALNLLPHLSRIVTPGNEGLLAQVLDRFFKDGDKSQFGLANAVTAVARDTRDPDLRWRLEELGGGIAIGITPRQPKDGRHAARAREELAVAAR